MVAVAQSVRVVVCGAIGRRFESGQPPKNPRQLGFFIALFCVLHQTLLCAGMLGGSPLKGLLLDNDMACKLLALCNLC